VEKGLVKIGEVDERLFAKRDVEAAVRMVGTTVVRTITSMCSWR